MMKKNRHFSFWLARKHVFILFFLLSSFFVGNAQLTNTGTSTNGTFTVTKSTNLSAAPTGGGNINYTYTVKNISAAPLYFQSISDNKISTLNYQSGMTTTYLAADILHQYGKQTLAAGASAVWTATQNITQTTTNVVTANFGTTLTGTFLLVLLTGVNITGGSAGSATVTVPLTPGSTLPCGTLWYSSDVNTAGSCNNPGQIGSITTAGVPTSKLTISSAGGTNSSTLVGSAALAVNPTNPDLIYFVPRNEAQSTYGGLYAYSQTSGTSTQLVTDANTPNVVRLGCSADGTVWSIDANGVLYSIKSPATTFTTHGTIVLPSNAIGAPTAWSSLQSGDLAFDGNGTMYFIGSSSGTILSYLYSLSAADLGTSGPTATLIGNMGAGSTYNGIAFADDGTLYATAVLAGTCNSTFNTVNVTTGAATLVATITGKNITDLGSCSLPKPVLTFTKTLSQSGAILSGNVLTYTLTVSNIGTLVASNVALQDAIPSGTTYVLGSTTLNGTPVADAGGTTMPFASSNSINSTGAGTGRIAPAGGTAVVTFQVLVTTVAGSVCNQGNVTYTGLTGTLTSDDPSQSGSADATCLTVLANFSVKGTVYDDNNGTTGGVGGTGLAGVTVQLKDATGTTVLGTTTTGSDGSYTFSNLALVAGSYTVVVTLPTATPAYQNVSSTDATPTDGSTAVTIVATNITGLDFGLHQPPTAGSNTQAGQSNPGGIGNMTAASTSFTGTDPNSGSIVSLTITAFPLNVNSITINGTKYNSNSFPAGGVVVPTNASGNPTQTILVDPREGTGNPAPVITYTVLDAAGLTSPSATVTLPITAVLPLQLISFTGSVNNCNVNLNWVTADEQNFNYFNIQYSTDGIQFATIGKINGKGGSQQNVYDFASTQASGNGFYRLSMVDKDGSFVLSNTISINVQCANGGVKWRVYPNPITVGSGVNLTLNNFEAQESKVRVVIMSLLGQKLQDYTVTLKVGTNNAIIPATNCVQGSTYMISVFDAQGKAVGTVQKLLFR